MGRKMGEQSCRNCVFAGPLRFGRRKVLVCANRPEKPGDLTVVEGKDCCRSFRARRGPVVRVEPPEPPNDKIKYIPLTKGKFAIVDAADYPALSKYKWHALEVAGGFYAARHERGKMVLMHRVIMQPPEGMVVDHIDRNRANNRRSNLRVCTQRQNRCNSRPCGGRSGFKGVSPQGHKWVSQLKYRGKSYRAGVFADPVDAARARDLLAVDVLGEYAWLNLPEEIRVRIRNLAGTLHVRSGARARLRVVGKDGPRR